jgi:hypothetical protein
MLSLKSLPAGTKVSISVKYSGAGAGRVTAMFEL